MADPNGDELRAELDRVRKERDEYRAIAADLFKRQFNIDLCELEAELKHVREHGGVPWSEIEAMLESEFGIKL